MFFNLCRILYFYNRKLNKHYLEQHTMRKLLPLIMGIATLAWIVGGTVWYRRNYCDSIAVPPVTAPTVAIKEGTQTIKHNAPFFFPLADSHPVFFSESIPVLKKTVDFLNQNIDQSLIIKGLYSIKEKNIKPNTDLGMYRANAIKAVLTGLGADSESISVESSVSENLHFVNNQLTDGIRFEFVQNYNVTFQALNLYFPTQKYQFVESDELQTYFRNLGKFLVVNPQLSVIISAHASITEGGQLSQKRLNYIQTFLEKKKFNLDKFKFVNKKIKTPLTKDKSIKNQRIEIRLASI